MTYKITARFLFILLTAVSLISACSEQLGSGSENYYDSNASIPVPRAITQSRIDPSELTLDLSVDGNDVNAELQNGQWVATMTLPYGQTVQLLAAWGTQGIVLATLDLGIVALKQNQQIVISEDAYVYPDDDDDNYTNLDEVDANTDHTNAGSFPTIPPVIPTTNTPPKLSNVNPASLNFEAMVTESGKGEIRFSNSGTLPLTFTIVSTEPSFLSASPVNGEVAANQSATLSVTAACGTEVETRKGVVVIESNGGSQAIDITVKCNSAAPPSTAILGTVNPESLSLTAQIQQSASDNIEIENIGTADLNYTATSEQNWLGASPNSGTVAPGNKSTVSVSASCGSNAGVRDGTLSIQSNGGNSNLAVSISCNSSPMGVISNINPQELNLTANDGESVNAEISFENDGSADLQFAITSGGDSSRWLSFSPLNGSLGAGERQTLALTATCASGQSETLSTNLSITNTDTENTQRIPVSLECTRQSGLAEVSPLTQTIEAEVSTTASGSISLRNDGNSPLDFAAVSENPTWLSVSPVIGTVMAGDTQVFEFLAICGQFREEKTGTISIATIDETFSATVTLQCSVPFPEPTSSLKFTLVDQCDDGADVQVKFFEYLSNTTNSATGWVWPSGSGVFVLSGSEEYSLLCRPDRNICFGAAVPDQDSVWGVGLDGDQPCTECCAFCLAAPSELQSLELTCN